MKIQPKIFNCQSDNLQNAKADNVQNQTNFNYNKMNFPQEISGRSLVNFKGNEEFDLTKEDNRFLNYITGKLNYSKEKTKKVKEIVKNYLKENKYKTLKELSGEDKIEEFGAMVDRIIDNAHMSERDSVCFIGEYTKIIDFNENHKVPQKNYLKDFKRLSNFANNKGLEPFTTITLHNKMMQDARAYGLNSTFDLFKSNINFNQTETYQFMKNVLGLEQEEIDNFIMDIVKSPVKSSDLPLKIDKEQIFSRMHNTFAFIEIAKKFNLKSEKAEEIYDILCNTYLPETSEKLKMNQKIAFLIADKYSLPVHAEKDIIKILEHIQALPPQEMCEKFLKIFFK